MAVSFRQLDAFRRVMETGSVTSAAELVHLSQPAVSKLLAALERELGLTLFVRVRQRLTPTEDAQLLYDEVLRQMASLVDIRDFARGLARGDDGELNLVSAASIGNTLIADAVVRLSARHPRVRISHRITTQVPQGMRHRGVDLGFSVLWVEQAGVEAVPMLHARAIVALPRGHRLTSRARITPEDLHDEVFISFSRDSRMRHIIDAQFEQRQVRRRMTFEVYASQEAVPLVARGAGISLVEPLASWLAPAHPVEYRPFDPAIEFTFNRLQPVQRPPTRLARVFLELLDERIEECLAESVTSGFPIELRRAETPVSPMAAGRSAAP